MVVREDVLDRDLELDEGYSARDCLPEIPGGRETVEGPQLHLLECGPMSFPEDSQLARVGIDGDRIEAVLSQPPLRRILDSPGFLRVLLIQPGHQLFGPSAVVGCPPIDRLPKVGIGSLGRSLIYLPGFLEPPGLLLREALWIAQLLQGALDRRLAYLALGAENHLPDRVGLVNEPVGGLDLLREDLGRDDAAPRPKPLLDPI